MKASVRAKRKRRKPSQADEAVEVISLRDPQALLQANERMNDAYGDGYVAYLDERRGSKLYRRIVAHGKDLLTVNDAIESLPVTLQRKVALHYAMKPRDYIEMLPGRM
jgi:hypothetical protein